MLRLLADEDFNNHIIRGLRRKLSEIDVVRVQDMGLAAGRDDAVLDWAAAQQRIVLTHDARTMIGRAYQRVRDGRAMPGLFVVPQSMSIGNAIEDLLCWLSAARPMNGTGL